MIMLVAVFGTLPSPSFGVPYPGARFEAAPEQRSCYTRYRLSTDAGIAKVADFYTAEATRAGVALVDDTKTRFADYRTLTFITQPKFMFVILDRRADRTIVVVSYKMSAAPDCR